jgi:gamma-glutamyltranspeptidase
MSEVGAAAAWVDIVETFGGRKLSLADVLGPAIRLAEEGYDHAFALLSHPCTQLRLMS